MTFEEMQDRLARASETITLLRETIKQQNDAYNMLLRRLENPELPTWRPIATAPKDHSYFLILSPREQDPDERVYIGRWSPAPFEGSHYWENTYGSMMDDNPAAWMPLP